MQRCAIVDRVRQRLGQVGEDFRHLGLRLEVALGGERARAALVGEHVTFGDADARLVGLEVFAAEELHRVGGYRRQAEPAGEAHRGVDVALLLRMSRALQLEVVRVREERRPRRGEPLRGGAVPGGERRPHVTRQRARERDQPLRAPVREPGLPELRAPAVLVLEVGAAQEVGQTPVARAGADEEQQAVRLVALGFVRDPDVAADDRLEAGFPRALVEVDHAEHVGEVGERERAHAVGRRARDRVVDPHDPVDDRELAVQPKMDEGGLRHGGVDAGAAILAIAAAPVAGTAQPGVEREPDQQLNR